MSLPPLPFLAKTKVSWTGEQEEDLGFLENEIVRVFSIVDELWWQGSLSRNGAEGIFPKDFVTVLPSSQAGSAQLIPTKTKSAQVPALVASTTQKSGRKSNPVTPIKSEYRTNDRTGPFGSAGKAAAVGSKLSSTSDDYNHSFDNTYDISFHRQLHMKANPISIYSQHALGLTLTIQPIADNSVSTQTKRLSKLTSPENSPIRSRVFDSSVRVPEQDNFFQTISQKKQELETQLHHLRQLEKSHLLHKNPILSNLSDLSEELLLSKHNCFSKEESVPSMYNTESTASDEEDAPPPPPKHKAEPFDADEFRASGATTELLLTSYSQFPEEYKLSIKSVQSDVLNLSELSATSAGSFLRHRNERDFQILKNELAQNSSNTLNASAPREDTDLVNSIFKSKKTRQQNLFKKLIKKKPEQNASEVRLETGDDAWQQVKVDLNRMNSLSSPDKQTRTRQVVRSEPNFIVKPLEYVSEINISETYGPDEIGDFSIETNTQKVANFLSRYDHGIDFNDLISDISVKFSSSKADQIRAVLLHLCKFRIIDEGVDILRTKPKLCDVMSKSEATIYQLNYLFKKLLEALYIPSEVVLGFWKKPNEFYHSDQFLINHCWLSVMIESSRRGNGTFRMIDLLCYQKGLICNLEGVNEFYFLAKPLDLVSTHIPSAVELQHVFPPIDLNVAFHLPRMYSSFEKNNLKFINFNNALTRMNDLEIFEADILIPPPVELFTLIKASSTTSHDYTLCQVYWNGTQRIAKVKAILPEKECIGVLQIFAGQKGLQTHFDNIHELACVIPLYHSGISKECTFVPRYPTIQSQNNDLYIKHPQTSIISMRHAYNFEIDAHPSQGINSGSAILNTDFKLVIESPSGKYTKLVSDGPYKTHGTYRANIFCQEQGLYRGLVIGDSGNSWYVFGQWECCS